MEREEIGASKEEILAVWEQIKKINRETTQQQQKIWQAQHPEYEPFFDYIYDERDFAIYVKAQLIPKKITRWSLISPFIDINFKGYSIKTNQQLMEKGKPPYLAGNKKSLRLHHMQQRYEAPFAELTVQEHTKGGNFNILHRLDEESWRIEKAKQAAFDTEREEHWKLRLKGLLQDDR